MYIIDQVAEHRNNRKILLLIVYIALFLDNMLLTTVVPIIPEYLLRISHPNETDILLHTNVVATSNNKSGRGKRAMLGGIEWDRPVGPIDVGDDLNAPFLNERLYNENPAKGKYAEQSKGKMNERVREEEERVEESTQRRMPDHKLIAEENVHVGLMFGSKALVQVLANPLVGPLTNRIGYTMPMFTGFCIMFISTVMFAFGESFGVLWLARALQGIGSACTSTSGMGMLAQAYTDDLERGSVMGIALGGLAMGVLVGPPFGGILYEYAGKELPFVLLALLALADGAMQFLVLQPKIEPAKEEGTHMKELIKDPYIIVAAGAITIGNLGIAMLEPSLPLWMMEEWSASSMERGLAFLPASISYLIGTNVFGSLAHRIGRWLAACIGLVVIGFSLLTIPSASSVYGLIVPNFCMGFSIGMIDASMFPLMGWLVDIRHVGVYGSIYAIADAAFCFAFVLGPFFAGPLVKTVKFPAMLYIIAFLNFAYAPLMFFLRNPPAREETNGTLPVNAEKPAEERYEKIEGTAVTQADGYQYDW